MILIIFYNEKIDFTHLMLYNSDESQFLQNKILIKLFTYCQGSSTSVCFFLKKSEKNEVVYWEI